MGLDAMSFVFWMLSFKLAFSLSFFLWQNPLQCCEVISLQLIKINEKKKHLKKQKQKKKFF